MSVLIEALTLVVPRKVLAVSYPGGTDAFLNALLELERPPRFICGEDTHLVNVSFYDSAHLEPASQMLEERGVVVVDDDRFVEMAYVDQKYGPTMPCDWLEWRRHAGGFTSAWLAGTEPGDMAVPVGWTPEQSRGLQRHDVRDEPGRCMRLAVENGLETWVDFTTGELVKGLPQRDEAPAAASGASSATACAPTEPEELGEGEEPLFPMVTAALEEREWTYTVMDGDSAIVRVRDVKASYDVFITTCDETRYVCCYCLLSVRVPQERRPAVADLLNRINWRIVLGNCELDVDSGEIRLRATVNVDGGRFSSEMLGTMLTASVYATEQYHDAVMQVAFGGAEPGEAFEGVSQR